DRGGLGHVREPSTCSRVSAHRCRPKAAGGRAIEVGAVVGGDRRHSRATDAGGRAMSTFRTRKRRDRELDEELQGHLRRRIDERVARGESRHDAELAARREFGNVGVVTEVTREMWGGGWVERRGRGGGWRPRTRRPAP